MEANSRFNPNAVQRALTDILFEADDEFDSLNNSRNAIIKEVDLDIDRILEEMNNILLVLRGDTAYSPSKTNDFITIKRHQLQAV
jgi:hypothetical protein